MRDNIEWTYNGIKLLLTMWCDVPIGQIVYGFHYPEHMTCVPNKYITIEGDVEKYYKYGHGKVVMVKTVGDVELDYFQSTLVPTHCWVEK